MIPLFLGILIVLVVGVRLFDRLKKPEEQFVHKNNFLSSAEAETVVDRLVSLGYYKYADPKDVDGLKKGLISSIADHGTLSADYFETSITPKDFRYYIFDGETVFEEGGFDSSIKDMKGTFDKIGLQLEITDHIEDMLDTGLHHELTVNGKCYVIFRNFKKYGWGEAPLRFAEMINDQLEIQNKDERLYLINGGNDGVAIFLTDQQFQLLDQVLTDDYWKPLETEKWAKVFEAEQDEAWKI